MTVAAATGCLMSLATPSVAAPQKRVLMLVAGTAEGPASARIVGAVESAVRASASAPVCLSRFAVDRQSFPWNDPQAAPRLKDALLKPPPNVVVAVSMPALDFALEHRDDMFRGIPIVFGFVDERMLRPGTVGQGVTGAFVRPDADKDLELLLRLRPAMREVVLVGGVSDFDRGFQAAAIPETRRVLGSKRTLRVVTDLSLRDLLGEIAMLPDDAIVFYLSMSRDAAGATFVPVDVLTMLRRVSRVPIYSPITSYFGSGIVGGSMVDVAAHGRDLGRIVGRILAGERAGDIAPVTSPNRLAFDGRELARLGVREAALPAGTVVLFRQSGFLSLRPREIAVAAAVVAAQVLFVGLLLGQRRKRRSLERNLDLGLQFEMLLADLSAALVTVDAQRMDAAVRSGLDRLRRYLDVDWTSLFEVRDARTVERTYTDERPDVGASPASYSLTDLPFITLKLSSLQPFAIETLDDLPGDAVHERAVLSHLGTRSLLLLPLAVGGEAMGALCCLSKTRTVKWTPELVERLRMVAEVLANAVKRRRGEAAMADSERLNAAILSSMAAHIAVVDRHGVIIAVNGAWTLFGRAGGVKDETSISPGVSYEDICRRAAASGDAGAAEALDGLRAVCDGRGQDFECEYRCDTADGERWFSMKVVPLLRPEGGAVVTHRDITDQKRHTIALRESEQRFRALAAAQRELSGRLIRAQEAERRRIALDLHDDLQQRLALLAIGLDGLALGQPVTSCEVTALARDLARQTVEISKEVQRLSYSLHPSKLEALGLLTTVTGYCKELSQQALRVNFTHENVPRSIPSDVSLCLFRILQESLGNVRKHSGSPTAQVTLSATDGALRLQVADAGRGFDVTKAMSNGGLGLVSMRERLYLIGGKMTIESTPGKGTRIHVSVPLATSTPAPGKSDVRTPQSGVPGHAIAAA